MQTNWGRFWNPHIIFLWRWRISHGLKYISFSGWIQFNIRMQKKMKSRHYNHKGSSKQQNNTLHLIKWKELQWRRTERIRWIGHSEEWLHKKYLVSDNIFFEFFSFHLKDLRMSRAHLNQQYCLLFHWIRDDISQKYHQTIYTLNGYIDS